MKSASTFSKQKSASILLLVAYLSYFPLSARCQDGDDKKYKGDPAVNKVIEESIRRENMTKEELQKEEARDEADWKAMQDEISNMETYQEKLQRERREHLTKDDAHDKLYDKLWSFRHKERQALADIYREIQGISVRSQYYIDTCNTAEVSKLLERMKVLIGKMGFARARIVSAEVNIFDEAIQYEDEDDPWRTTIKDVLNRLDQKLKKGYEFGKKEFDRIESRYHQNCEQPDPPEKAKPIVQSDGKATAGKKSIVGNIGKSLPESKATFGAGRDVFDIPEDLEKYRIPDDPEPSVVDPADDGEVNKEPKRQRKGVENNRPRRGFGSDRPEDNLAWNENCNLPQIKGAWYGKRSDGLPYPYHISIQANKVFVRMPKVPPYQPSQVYVGEFKKNNAEIFFKPRSPGFYGDLPYTVQQDMINKGYVYRARIKFECEKGVAKNLRIIAAEDYMTWNDKKRLLDIQYNWKVKTTRLYRASSGSGSGSGFGGAAGATEFGK